MAKFLFTELVDPRDRIFTARLGAGTGAANNWTDKEVGKFVKLGADSRYVLAAVGDLIEGRVEAIETATLDAYTIGSVRSTGRMEVTFDGSQAAGTGAIAVGDFVVVGTVVAKDTALSGPAKVRKATIQPGITATPDAGHIAAAMKAWRVVSLGSAGTGDVGTTGIIERVAAF